MKNTTEIIRLVDENRDVIWRSYLANTHLVNNEFNKLEKHQKNALIFLSINSPVRLCRLVSTSFRQVQDAINNPIYKTYAIAKKRGGKREIDAPAKVLKTIQKKLNYFLQGYYLLIKPREVMGFVINLRYIKTRCTILENARVHSGKKTVLNIDLKDFFPSISAQRVKSLFMSSVFEFNEI